MTWVSPHQRHMIWRCWVFVTMERLVCWSSCNFLGSTSSWHRKAQADKESLGNEVLLKKMVGHQTGDHQNPIKCKWCWRVPEFPLLSRKSNKKNMLIMGKMFMNFTPIFFTTKCSPINPIPTIMSTKGTVHPLLQPPVHHHRFVPHDLHSEWSRHHHLHLDFSTRNACYLNSNGPPRLVGVFSSFSVVICVMYKNGWISVTFDEGEVANERCVGKESRRCSCMDFIWILNS